MLKESILFNTKGILVFTTNGQTANGKKLKQVKSARYLGDIISNDVDELIESRAGISFGYVATCLAMLTETSLGYQLVLYC